MDWVENSRLLPACCTLEELLHPEAQPDGIDLDVLERCFMEWREMLAGGPALLDVAHD
jgi:hypothetical protein